MFGWFKKRDPLERGLYRYHDGTAWQLADPLIIEGKLEAAGGKDWVNDLAVIQAATSPVVPVSGRLAEVAAEDTNAAILRLVTVTRAAFGIPEVQKARCFRNSGNSGKTVGLSGAEVLTVLAGYLTFLGQLRERYGPLVKSPARPAKSPGEPDTGEWSPVTSSDTPAAGNG